MPSPARYAQRVLDNLRISDKADLEMLDAIAWERGALVIDERLEGGKA